MTVIKLQLFRSCSNLRLVYDSKYLLIPLENCMLESNIISVDPRKVNCFINFIDFINPLFRFFFNIRIFDNVRALVV